MVPTPLLQLTSEFVILSLRVEDAGTFFCSAENPAGVASANFTVAVLSRDGDTAVKSSVVSQQHSNTDNSGPKTSIDAETDNQQDMTYKVGTAIKTSSSVSKK